MPAKARTFFGSALNDGILRATDGFGVFDGRAGVLVLTQKAEAPRFGLRSVRSLGCI
jgi:hypothetical protein